MKKRRKKNPEETQKKEEEHLNVVLSKRDKLEQEVNALQARINIMQLDLDEQHGRVLRFRNEFDERTEWALSLNKEVKQLQNELEEANRVSKIYRESNLFKFKCRVNKVWTPLLLPIRCIFRSSRIFGVEPILIKTDVIRNTLFMKGKYRPQGSFVKTKLFIQIGKANWQATITPIEEEPSTYEFSIEAVIGNGLKCFSDVLASLLYYRFKLF